MTMSSTTGPRARAVLFVLAASLWLAGCSTYPYRTREPDPYEPWAPTVATATRRAPQADVTWAPPPVDPLWPTRDPELLAVPESERWYTAHERVGTTTTVVGPVVRVYQATQSQGMPIFVDIGVTYPDSRSVALVIWADAYPDVAEMLDEVSGGGAWLSVTGYLSTYRGRAQLDIDDGPVEYRWWTAR